MADQQYVIKTDQGDFRIMADADMPTDQVLSLAAATNPKFALYHAQAQARASLASGITSSDDAAALKELSLGLGRTVTAKDVPEGMTARQMLDRYKAGSSLEVPAQMLGTMATAGIVPAVAKGAPLVQKALGLAGRSVASGAGMAAGELAAGGTPDQARTAAITGAVSQPIAEGISAAAGYLAPKLAESALKISGRMRGRGATIGDAVLENTTGITPSTLESSTKKAVSSLVSQMEDAVDSATQAGATGTTQEAHDVLNDSIANLPRNARAIKAKMESLHDLLDLDSAPNGPVRRVYTPNELLEMKRGIGQEIKTWPPEWQRIGAVKQVQERMYGAIDSELDRIVPGNAEINQTIQSLIPAKSQAKKISDAASFVQLLSHRAAAHTGALTAGVVGGAYGAKKGGIPGAIAGTAAGLAVPEMIASTPGQMAMARILNALGPKAVAPEILPLVKALADHVADRQANQELDTEKTGE